MTTRQTTAPSGFAVGVTVAAAIILIIGGICHAMQGVVGIATNEFYVTTQKWIFQFDVTTWGWIHVIVGAVAVLAGIGLFSGAVWARTLAVAIAAVSILVNFAWLPYYPIWSVLIIAFDFFVIWALTAHGRDVVAVSGR
ncbi:MAG: hypothetical protein U0R72_12405 [Nakamurella multipartita]|jgi:hypothetical protein